MFRHSASGSVAPQLGFTPPPTEGSFFLRPVMLSVVHSSMVYDQPVVAGAEAMNTAELWQRFHAELYAFLLARVRSEPVAQDLLQSAFLKAHRSLSRGEFPQRPRAWLYQIARNLTVDAHRKNARQQRLSAASSDANSLRVADESEDQDALGIVARALPILIDGLEPAYREALRMTELRGLTQSEAAARAGISLSGMKSRVQRARKQLRQALLRCCEFEIDGRGRPLSCTPRDGNGFDKDRGCC